jgi:DNA polymerase V
MDSNTKEFNYDQMTGFPSPCKEFAEDELSLDKEYLHNRASTYIIQIENDVRELGIVKHDRLIIDRSLPPREGQMVLLVINNEFTVKRFSAKFLETEDLENGDFVWGVITTQIRKHL